jgi:O-antigen ligase
MAAKIETIKRSGGINMLAMIITVLLSIVHIMNTPETVKLLVSIFFLAIMLVLPSGDSIKYLMFVLCANELLNIGNTSLTMIFVALFFATRCFSSLTKKRIDGGIFLGFVLLLLACVISYIATENVGAFVATVKHVLFLYYIAYVLDNNRKSWKDLYANSFRYIAAGAICFAAITVAVKGLPSLIVRFTFSEEVTINFIGIVCALAVVNLIYIRFVLKNKTNVDIALMLGCIIVGIITQSRSFILAVALGVLLLILFVPSSKGKFKLITTAIVSIVVGVILISCVPIFSKYIDAVIGRITSPSGDDISNGRYDLWSLTIEAMTNNKAFFWFGAGDVVRVGTIWGDKINVAHNLFLETWVIYGIIGCAILLIVHFIYIKHCLFGKSTKKFEMVSLVPIIVLLCCLFYSHHFIGRSMSMVFIFSFLPVVIDNANHGEED